MIHLRGDTANCRDDIETLKYERRHANRKALHRATFSVGVGSPPSRFATVGNPLVSDTLRVTSVRGRQSSSAFLIHMLVCHLKFRFKRESFPMLRREVFVMELNHGGRIQEVSAQNHRIELAGFYKVADDSKRSTLDAV
ncbi:hypothetical protein EVAR_3672_1 [Eumeta japonica]|uniref:Uncharacterized protein n=1 Tax=Eumeta variegata TaxID=151549 RepID=A0A4C1STZ9_EUMVA|nr:hypothetical protein EVAR_3672_1 [Eumeta japonica]